MEAAERKGGRKVAVRNSSKDNKPTSNGKVFESVFGAVAKYAKWVLVLALLLICFSGVYKVDSGNVAVVLRFGKLVGDTPEEQLKQPGLHFAFPFVVDEVITIPTDKVRECTVLTHYVSGNRINASVNKNGYLITGDENIVLIEMNVKYVVSDPVAYALYANDVEVMIDGVVSATTTDCIASMSIDDVLTTEKTRIASTIVNASQECLDATECGVKISSLELLTVSPPTETVSYFNAVNSAMITKETLINVAEQYASTSIPSAEADAKAMISAALSNQENALIVTSSELSVFYGYYLQYLDYPETVVDGILEQRAAVILNNGTLIIVSKDGTAPLIVLP